MMNPEKLQIYANAISAKGAPLDRCFGFIDCTLVGICKPGKTKEYYTTGTRGYMPSNALPNGIIGNLYGPVGKS